MVQRHTPPDELPLYLGPETSSGTRPGLYLAGDEVTLLKTYRVYDSMRYSPTRLTPSLIPQLPIVLPADIEHYVVWLRSKHVSAHTFRSRCSGRSVRWPIDHLPRDLTFGQSVVVIAHAEAATDFIAEVALPGCVAAFRPTRLEILVREGASVLHTHRAQAAKALARGGDVRYYELAERQVSIDEVMQ